MPFKFKNLAALLLLTAGITASAQVLTLNDGTVLNATPHRVGLNLGALDDYDSGQIMTNLLWAGGNPGFEPMLTQNIQVVPTVGTTTTFIDENRYDGSVQNIWSGFKFTIVVSSYGGAEAGCTGTIASNTGPNRFQITAGSYNTTTGQATFTTPGNLVPVGGTFQAYYFPGALGFLDGQNATVLSGSTSTTIIAQYAVTHASVATIPLNNYGQINGSTVFVAPTYTINPTTNQGTSGCAAAFAAGDIVVISGNTFPTPEAAWETGFMPGVNGPGGSSGGAPTDYQYLSLTTGLCSTCGQQALQINVNNPSGYAQFNNNFDNNTNDIFTLLDSTVTTTFQFKTITGTPQLKLTLRRSSTNGINCAQQTFTPTTSWTSGTYTCSGTELGIKDAAPTCTAGGVTTGCTQPGIVNLTYYVDCLGGVPCSLALDNVVPSRASDTTSNVSNMRKGMINSLAQFKPQTFRDWEPGNNCTTIDNWTNPDYAMQPCGLGSSNASYILDGQDPVPLNDYLNATNEAQIAAGVSIDPYLEIPVTMLPADGPKLIDFLAGSCSTTYGAKRCALGQTTPWSSVFGKIHLIMCNECWNPAFVKQNLQGGGQPDSETYYYYSATIAPVYAAMRADSNYPSNIELGMNLWTAVPATANLGIARAKPDAVEVQNYLYHIVNSDTSDEDMWGPLVPDAWLTVYGPGSADKTNFYNSIQTYQGYNLCGASGTAKCIVNIYEWGQGTVAGSLSQSSQDSVDAGGGTGMVDIIKPMLDQQIYHGTMGVENFFAQNEYINGGSNANIAKLWGNQVDIDGATDNKRPNFLADQLLNAAIIGPMYQCNLDSSNLYNYAGNANNGETVPPGVAAISNIFNVFSFCFSSGSTRNLVLVNSDVINPHTISFAGTNVPSGTVHVTTYAPPTPDTLNEAPTGSTGYLIPQAVNLVSSTLTSPASITLAPYSAVSLSYSTGGTPTAATPTFSPVAGSYVGTQTVTLSTASSGCSGYLVWNTTGASSGGNLTGTTTGISVTVATSETVYAQVQGCPAYLNSAIGSAAYTITAPTAASPTFTPPAGIYGSAQSVTLATTTGGATICYTTNGTNPTAPTAGTCGGGSTAYTGPITVSVTQTIAALATVVGYNNSSIASATYQIGIPVAATPTFTPAAGSYVGTVTVSLATTTAGAAIHYTEDGTTPTSASPVYTTPLLLTVSTTIKAIAIAAGYTNSAVGTAAYTVTIPTFTCSQTGVSVTFSGSKVTLQCPQ